MRVEHKTVESFMEDVRSSQLHGPVRLSLHEEEQNSGVQAVWFKAQFLDTDGILHEMALNCGEDVLNDVQEGTENARTIFEGLKGKLVDEELPVAGGEYVV